MDRTDPSKRIKNQRLRIFPRLIEMFVEQLTEGIDEPGTEPSWMFERRAGWRHHAWSRLHTEAQEMLVLDSHDSLPNRHHESQKLVVVGHGDRTQVVGSVFDGHLLPTG